MGDVLDVPVLPIGPARLQRREALGDEAGQVLSQRGQQGACWLVTAASSPSLAAPDQIFEDRLVLGLRRVVVGGRLEQVELNGQPSRASPVLESLSIALPIITRVRTATAGR